MSLGEGISPLNVDLGDEICIPGYDAAIRKDRVKFMVLVDGVVKENGNTYLSSFEYPASDVKFGHFQEIDADYDESPRAWPGWDRFEENCEMYVFGYGSLVSPASVEQTLGHAVVHSSVVPAFLEGWERRWNVGSDTRSHPERTFYLQDDRAEDGRGPVFNGVTAVLGIERFEKSRGCNGAVFPVSRADLSLLDVRERNYDRIAVTDAVSFAGKPSHCMVYTYIPKDSAKQNIHDARQQKIPMNVRREYVDLVERAFGSVGPDALSEYHATTPDPDFDMPVVSMKSVIKEGTASPIAATAMASYFADSDPATLTADDVTTVADDTVVPRQEKTGAIELSGDE